MAILINNFLFPRKISADQAEVCSRSRDGRPWTRALIPSLLRMAIPVKQGSDSAVDFRAVVRGEK